MLNLILQFHPRKEIVAEPKGESKKSTENLHVQKERNVVVCLLPNILIFQWFQIVSVEVIVDVPVQIPFPKPVAKNVMCTEV